MRNLALMAGAALALAACGGASAEGPQQQDVVKIVEAYYANQAQQALPGGTAKLEVKDASGLKHECQNKPNGDWECRVTGEVKALLFLNGKSQTEDVRPVQVDQRMTFTRLGDGWKLIQAEDFKQRSGG